MRKIVIALVVVLTTYTSISIFLAYYVFKHPHQLFGLTQICEPDNKLGWSIKPLSKYSYELPINHKLIEYQSSSLHCRVNTNRTDKIVTNGAYLFLGCSCTYGLNCNADETYPEIVSKQFNKTCVNASVPGTGFAVMLEQARNMIPKVKPEYVFIQNSNWLMDRSSYPFTETFPWVLSVPYFSKSNAVTGLTYPLFNNDIFFLSNLGIHKNSKIGVVDFITFFFKALRVFIYKHVNLLFAKIKVKLYNNYQPQENYNESYKYFYTELKTLCKLNNAKIVVIDYSNLEGEYQYKNGLPVVNADSLLMIRLNGQDYSETYHFIDPKTKQMFDNHPNPIAHKTIAEGIIAFLNNPSY